MSQEYKVVIETELSDDLKKEIDEALRSAVLQKLAKLDLSKEWSVAKLGGIGGSHTAGMLVK